MTFNSTANQLHEAARALAADDPDHARVLNGIGFSKADSWFGHYLVTVDPSEWTAEIVHDAYSCLIYYREQLAAKGINFDDIERPDSVQFNGGSGGGAGRQQVTDRRRAIKAAADAEAKQAALIAERSVTVTNGFIAIRWNKKDPEFQTFYRVVKAAGARWNGLVWQLSISQISQQLINDLAAGGFVIPDEIKVVFEKAPEKPVIGTVTINGTNLKIKLIGRLNGNFDTYRSLVGYSWQRGTDISYVAAVQSNIDWLAANGFSGTDSPEIQALVAQTTTAKAEAEVQAQELYEASTAAKSTTSFDHLLPEGLSAYPFQTAGVEYALRTRRTFIADEMGLGKTIQALITVEASQSFPAIVICPASLKGNWVREINHWFPGRTVNVLNGRTPNPVQLRGFDFIICNYDILSGWVDALITESFKALVLDESHYAKEPKSKRTKAAIELSKSIPQDGIRLCLTGTPILNRPKELVAQLQILGRLTDVVGASKRNPAGAFLYRYCGPETNRWGTTFNGATNLTELNEKLRQVCYIRRQREEVLGLNDTKRRQIPLSLNGALSDYNRAEADIIRYIRDELGTAAAIRAKQAEVLVRLNTLRRLAEEAKIQATIEWVEDWLESYPTKSLVVFAEHVSVQQALQAHFNCPSILGGQKDVEAQKEVFQSGKARIIVCSLKAAREGHTLTAASDVVFTSLGWTPGGLQQAEDRCNRIGQTANQVFAWQLHAADTIDEEIGRLIEIKRATFNSVVNGEEVDVDDSVVDGVVDYLRSK